MIEPQSEQHLTQLLDTLSLHQKVRLLTGETFWSLYAEPAIGLRPLIVSDGPAGVRGTLWDERDTSASLPSPTAVAASWDDALVYRLGELIAAEARRKGVDAVLGPTVNIQRSPRGGRHFEQYSEDPYLSGAIGTAFVRGVQDHGVGATAKHYVANDSETDRMTVDVHVDERTLREVYLAPFDRIVHDAKAWLVMSSYNSVNGTTMSENDLLHSPLKDEWEFDGVVISDWGGVRSTEAAGRADNDLAMPGPMGPWGDALVAAVQAGAVPESAIDAKVLRILRLAARVGALEGTTSMSVPTWSDADVSALLRHAAAEGMVLVRNRDDILPLPTSASVAVIGQNALLSRTQGGGSATVTPDHVVTPLAGITAAFGAENVSFAVGVRSVKGIQPFDRSHCTDPNSGEPGIAVTFTGRDGKIIDRELRHAGKFIWMGDARLASAGAVEATTTYTAREDGTHYFGFAGLGAFEMTIDGEVVANEVIQLDGIDPVVGFMSPPERTVARMLTAGQSVTVTVRHTVTLMEALPAVAFTVGVETPYESDEDALARAVATAAAADVAVVVVGTTEQLESEGFDRPTLSLPEGQDELVRQVAAANPQTVVIVNSGSPVLMPWLEQVKAVLLTWFPGQEAGDAVADVLTGAAEPGGRTPNTWPMSEADVPVWQVEPVDGALSYTEGIHVGYREWTRRGSLGGPSPAVEFGFGLGYTQWQYGHAHVTSSETGVDIEIDATNIGSRAGKDVLQVYLSRPGSAVDRPVRWLAGHATIRAEAGASATAHVHLPLRAFQHWSVDAHGWTLEPGEFTVIAARSVNRIVDSVTVTMAPDSAA